jgi:hypothetical protein
MGRFIQKSLRGMQLPERLDSGEKRQLKLESLIHWQVLEMHWKRGWAYPEMQFFSSFYS